MDPRYELYCFGDPVFYDLPAADPEVAGLARPAPDGWERRDGPEWVEYAPADSHLPQQGWKIHVSASLENAEAILATVWDYCVARRIAFKHLSSLDVVFVRNAKSADRWSSGKFVTIYPSGDDELERVLRELGRELAGRAGPYILSDLRWDDGPLYIRYGGFAARYCIGPTGERQPAIENGEGRLVPDERATTFRVPPWVVLPTFLAPHLTSRNAATVDELDYRIEAALQFSNSGGLYRAVDQRTGTPVILKEARPLAGLSRDGADAVTRLERERTVLRRLAGLPVPCERDHFVLGEHHFLALDFVEGESLHALIVDRYPQLRWDDAAAVDSYTGWALDVVGRVEAIMAAVHDRGVVMGDLHPRNILIRPDGQPVLIDWESATEADDGARQVMGVPGFVGPPGLRGVDVDRYALACLRLHLFLPLTRLLAFDPSKAQQLAAEIASHFPVPDDFLDAAVAVVNGAGAVLPELDGGSLQPELGTGGAGWRRARDSMTRAILASATPERDDRLFPGDVSQFRPGGGINVAHGAAGVLWALDAVGAGRFPAHEDWLARRVLSPDADIPLGFYDGLLGAAFVLDRLGRAAEAAKVLDRSLERLAREWNDRPLGLYSGLAGITLALDAFACATEEPRLAELVVRGTDEVAGRLGDVDRVPAVSGGDHPTAGLLRGSSGVALMFIRRYERTGDAALLDAARTALRQDLRRCVTTADGALKVNEGWRNLPYLGSGSAGIGMILDLYLAHREDEQFTVAADRIRRAARATFYVQSGLFNGRAGLLLALSRGHPPGASPADDVVVDHVRRLAWHALSYRGHMAFPGDQLLRLSMDLATGTTGVMFGLGVALHDYALHLPFLGPPVTRPLPSSGQPVQGKE